MVLVMLVAMEEAEWRKRNAFIYVTGIFNFESGSCSRRSRSGKWRYWRRCWCILACLVCLFSFKPTIRTKFPGVYKWRRRCNYSSASSGYDPNICILRHRLSILHLFNRMFHQSHPPLLHGAMTGDLLAQDCVHFSRADDIRMSLKTWLKENDWNKILFSFTQFNRFLQVLLLELCV